jgi:hypothetical protein
VTQTKEAAARRRAREDGRIVLDTMTRDQLLHEARRRGAALMEKERIIKALVARADDQGTEVAALSATIDGLIRAQEQQTRRLAALEELLRGPRRDEG